jgi:hypothetical protein
LTLTLLTVSLVGCGSASRQPSVVQKPSPASPVAVSPLSIAAPPVVKGPGGGLAIGLTEGNANLLSPAPDPVPSGFMRARGLLSALAPEYMRIDVDWAALEPAPGDGPQLDLPVSGCSRTLPPCGGYAGLDAQFQALAALRRSSPATAQQVVVMFFNAPAWAVQAPSGCEVADVTPGGRPVTPAGLQAYRRLVLAVLALGRHDGVDPRWWSAWDEPNQPLYISPQRASCSASAPSLAAGVYATLVRTLAGVLRQAGGEHEIVLGDLADIPAPGPHATGIGEFVGDLPEDVLCLSDVWAQHEYPKDGAPLDAPPGNPGDVALLERALDARGPCGRRARIWVTETGVGDPHAHGARSTSPVGLARSCGTLDRALTAWYRDPRVDVAFQYTFREDQLFPVGLISADLRTVYPAYRLLSAWAGGRSPQAPPPASSALCG